ncbi:MAG: zinc ribbon domain-containing protein [Candidatus Magnetominusculus sp. LBB02]|nr:zinc ribbon domain-containing protein [Candidatus Magnetominusculus sp. LBB02]
MPIVSLNCPNCGGDVHKEDKTCKYCHASLHFSPDHKQVSQTSLSCPSCGAPAEKGDRFCSQCDNALVVRCPSCRFDMPLETLFCTNCGVNIPMEKMKARYLAEFIKLHNEKENILSEFKETVKCKEIYFSLKWLSYAIVFALIAGALSGHWVGSMIISLILFIIIAKIVDYKYAADMETNDQWLHYLSDSQKSELIKKTREIEDKSSKLHAQRDAEMKAIAQRLDSTDAAAQSQRD